MATATGEYAEAADNLSAILKPLVNERVDSRMDAYVTKEHLDLKLAEMENRLTMRIGGLIVIMVSIATGIIKLTPTAPPAVIMMPSAFTPQAVQASPATQSPVLTLPAQ